MPIYRIEGPEGQTYEIEGPEGATREQVISAITEQLEAQQNYMEPWPTETLAGEAPVERSFLRETADIPLKAGEGVVAGVRMLADAFGANNPVSQNLRSVENYIAELYSAQSKADSQRVAEIMKAAEDEGVLANVKAAFEAFKVAPVDLLVNALGTSAPTILGGLGAGALKAGAMGVRATQAGLGATTGAGVTKGAIYEAVKEELQGSDLTPEQIEQKAQLAQSYNGENLDQILMGTGIGAVAGSVGIEPTLAGATARNILQRSVMKQAGATTTIKNLPPSALLQAGVGAIKEGGTEAIQGGQEQLAQNIALQREGFDVPTMRGVVGQGALEGLAGAGLGAPISGMSQRGINRQAEEQAYQAQVAQETELAEIEKERRRIAGIAAAAQQEQQAQILAAEQELQAREAELRRPLGEQIELDMAPETTVEEVAARRVAETPQGDLFAGMPEAAPTVRAPVQPSVSPQLTTQEEMEYTFPEEAPAFTPVEAIPARRDFLAAQGDLFADRAAAQPIIATPELLTSVLPKLAKGSKIAKKYTNKDLSDPATFEAFSADVEKYGVKNPINESAMEELQNAVSLKSDGDVTPGSSGVSPTVSDAGRPVEAAGATQELDVAPVDDDGDIAGLPTRRAVDEYAALKSPVITEEEMVYNPDDSLTLFNKTINRETSSAPEEYSWIRAETHTVTLTPEGYLVFKRESDASDEPEEYMVTKDEKGDTWLLPPNDKQIGSSFSPVKYYTTKDAIDFANKRFSSMKIAEEAPALGAQEVLPAEPEPVMAEEAPLTLLHESAEDGFGNPEYTQAQLISEGIENPNFELLDKRLADFKAILGELLPLDNKITNLQRPRRADLARRKKLFEELINNFNYARRASGDTYSVARTKLGELLDHVRYAPTQERFDDLVNYVNELKNKAALVEPESPAAPRMTAEERQQRIIQQRAEEEAARKAEREANLAEARAKQAGFAPPADLLPAEIEGLQAAREFEESETDDVDMSQRVEQGEGTTPAQIEEALQDWYIDPNAGKQSVKIVNTFNELPPNIAKVIGNKARERGIDKGAIQAFTHEGTAYLIADRIKPGTERSVFMHEVGAHLGLKQSEVNSIANKINKWANAAEGTIEKEVYNAVQQRMESAKELSNEELVAYTVEEAANRGVTPQAVLRAKAAPPNTIAGIIRYLAESFMNASKAAFNAFTSTPTPQDLIDYVYGSTRKTLQEGAVEKEPETTGWSEKRISGLMNKYAYGNDDERTKAYAVKMSPQKFLDITTEKGYQRELKKETTPLNKEQLAKETQDIFLYIDPTDNPNVFEVSGHEGRHRMIALARAGVTEVPVVLNLRGGQKVQPLDVAYLTAQRGGGVLGEGQQGEWVADLTPISYAYKDQLTDKFGKGSILFSARSAAAQPQQRELSDPAYVEPSKSLLDRLYSPKVADARTDLGAMISSITPKLLSLYQLVDQYGKRLKGLGEHRDLKDSMTVMQRNIKTKADPVLLQWNNFSAVDKNKAAAAALNVLMRDSTMAKIHPDVPFDNALNSHLTSDMEAQHAALAARFEALPEEAQNIYKSVRALNDEVFQMRISEFRKMVNDAYADELRTATPEQAEQINARIMKQLKAHENLINSIRGPYFTLWREGEFLTIAESPELTEVRKELEGDELTPEERKTLAARLRMMEASDEHYQVFANTRKSMALKEGERLKNLGLTVRQTKAEEALSNSRGMSMGSIDAMQRLLDEELDRSLDPATRSALRQAMIDDMLSSMPENSALQRQIKRRNVAGASLDMMKAFANSVERDSFYISRLAYMKPLSRTMIQMRDASKDSVKLRDVYNTVRKAMNLDMKQDKHPYLSKLTQLSSIYHLGIAPSYILTNLTQPFMITVPQLAGTYGVKKTNSAIAKAWGQSLRAIKGGRNGTFFSLDNVDLGKVFSGGTLRMVKELQDLGKLDIQNNMDTEVYTKGMNPKHAKFWQMFNWTSHNVELVNRLTTALAAYELELEKSKSEVAAVQAARDAVERTQLDYSDTNASLFMKQGQLGGFNRIPMQFRKYQQGMIYLLARNFINAWGGDKNARASFLYLMGTQLIMAGVRGVPFISPLLFLMDAFGDDDDPEGDIETQLRNALADSFGADTARALWTGLPAMMGVDAGSLSMENLLSPFPFLRTESITGASSGRDAISELMINAGGAPISLAVRLTDGFILMNEGDFQKGLEKTLPKFIAAPIKAQRLGDEGLTTRSGNVAVEGSEFSAWDQVIKGLGFSPAKEAEYYKAMYQKERVSSAIDKRRQRIIKEIATGRMEGKDVAEAMKRLREFNKDHPQRRIDSESISRSIAMRRKQARERGDTGVRFSKKDAELRGIDRFAR